MTSEVSFAERVLKSGNVKENIYNLPAPESENIRKIITQEQKKNKNQIEQKIQDLEREINDSVYQLYGLTKKEITLIEESLK